MLRCEDIKEMMSLYIDNQLNDIEQISFHRHIKECSSCQEELAILQSIVKTCNNLEEMELPSDFSEKLHEKLVQAQPMFQNVNPPWYLNWRMYSGLAAGIMLVFVLKSYAFDTIYNSMNKTENAYVSDAKLEYDASTAMKAVEETAGLESSTQAMEGSGGSEMKMAVEQPASPRMFAARLAPEEKVQGKSEEMKSGAVAMAPASIPLEATMDRVNTENRDEIDSNEINGVIKKASVCRGMYRDKKSLVVYNAVINTSQSNSEILWDRLQEKLTQFEGYYELRFRNDKPIVYISKDKYFELISSVRSTGLEFTIDTGETDKTSYYQDLITQCDDMQKKIQELQSKLDSTSEPQEVEAFNKELKLLLEKQSYLTEEIIEMDRAIGKYVIEVHIVQ